MDAWKNAICACSLLCLFNKRWIHRDDDDDDDGDGMRFTRTILQSDSSEYRIDGKKVSEKDYQSRLKSVGLLVKSRNFLVFQNEVEKVAQKSPKELTELIERISGSEVRCPMCCVVPLSLIDSRMMFG